MVSGLWLSPEIFLSYLTAVHTCVLVPRFGVDTMDTMVAWTSSMLEARHGLSAHDLRLLDIGTGVETSTFLRVHPGMDNQAGEHSMIHPMPSCTQFRSSRVLSSAAEPLSSVSSIWTKSGRLVITNARPCLSATGPCIAVPVSVHLVAALSC